MGYNKTNNNNITTTTAIYEYVTYKLWSVIRKQKVMSLCAETIFYSFHFSLNFLNHAHDQAVHPFVKMYKMWHRKCTLYTGPMFTRCSSEQHIFSLYLKITKFLFLFEQTNKKRIQTIHRVCICTRKVLFKNAEKMMVVVKHYAKLFDASVQSVQKMD